MDLRAFGGVYAYRAEVPYASGFVHTPTSTGASGIVFSTCRALFIESKPTGAGSFISLELNDAPGQYLRIDHIKGDTILPIACTAIASGDVSEVVVLF
jgi:hypothetical protein